MNQGNPLEKFEKALLELEKESSSWQTVPTPDLIALAGEEKATALLLRAMNVCYRLEFKDPATHRLAKKVAAAQIGQLFRPPWYLINSADDLALYESIAHKFDGYTKNDVDGKAAADQIHLLALIDAGRTDQAYRFLIAQQTDSSNRMSAQALSDPATTGDREKRFLFLAHCLSINPNLDLWNNYCDLGILLRRYHEMDRQLSEQRMNPATKPSVRGSIEAALLNSLFEQQRTEEALEKLAQFIDHARTRNEAGQEIELLLRAADLGRLLDRPKLIEESITAAVTALGKLNPIQPESSHNSPRLLGLLIEHQRFAEAEALIVGNITQMKALGQSDTDITGSLTRLAEVYLKAGRPGDLFQLLDGSPDWGVTDLSELNYSDGFLLDAAQALQSTGRSPEARQIIRRIISRSPEIDRGYALLISLHDKDTPAFLDQIFTSNPFQERPLIWKAKLLFDQGLLADAETTVRKAIAIDPSDGEQGKGDRMRAYSVLGEILEKRGDREQAEFMSKIVAAIRASEVADDWWVADIRSTAVRLYEQALNSFADAYCIQSRLALRYAEIGDMEKAAQYYQRAFELMPDSFGRVESHCFGCEGAFKGIAAQRIADRVFTALAAKPNAKPQVFYLLGYLRTAENRPQEAAEFYRKAVKADPEYLNAWTNLLSLADSLNMSAAERNEVVFKIYDLSRSASILSNGNDLRRLWTVVLETERSTPRPDSGPLYPLKAAADAIGSGTRKRSYYSRNTEAEEDIRDSLANHPLIHDVFNIIDEATTRN